MEDQNKQLNSQDAFQVLHNLEDLRRQSVLKGEISDYFREGIAVLNLKLKEYEKLKANERTDIQRG